MAIRRTVPWSCEEVRTFLGLIAEERIQRELGGAARNENVFQEVSRRMAEHGYQRSSLQCRMKLKKQKNYYKTIKEHGGRTGSTQSWMWFEHIDALYGHRAASNESVVTPVPSASSATITPQRRVTDKRKRSREQEYVTFLRDMQASDVEQQELNRAQQELDRAQRERHLHMVLEDAARAREQEAAWQRENAQTAAFNKAFLDTLSQLVP